MSALRPVKAPAADQLVPLAERPELAEIEGKIAKLHARIATAEERKTRARHRFKGTKPAATSLQLAERLVDGAQVDSADPGAEIAAAETELLHLGRGVVALLEERADIVSRLNYELSMTFRPQQEAGLRRLDRAIGEIHSAMSELRKIEATLHGAGYTISVSALPANVPQIIYQIGDPTNPSFPVCHFRRWLEKTYGTAP